MTGFFLSLSLSLPLLLHASPLPSISSLSSPTRKVVDGEPTTWFREGMKIHKRVQATTFLSFRVYLPFSQRNVLRRREKKQQKTASRIERLFTSLSSTSVETSGHLLFFFFYYFFFVWVGLVFIFGVVGYGPMRTLSFFATSRSC
jgi:hypothetical protein